MSTGRFGRFDKKRLTNDQIYKLPTFISQKYYDKICEKKNMTRASSDFLSYEIVRIRVVKILYEEVKVVF